VKITPIDIPFFWVSSFVGVQGHFFFLATNASYEVQLWQSDGTATGTSMLKAFPNAFGIDLKVVEDQLAVTEYGQIVFLYNPADAVALPALQTAVNLNQGVLDILGTQNTDTITVCRNSKDASRLLVTINGVRFRYLTSHVKSILIHGYAGNDRIIIDESFGTISASTHIWGGSGNDVIRTGCGRDTVDGEGGNDSIVSGNGNDVDNGGPGNDSINSGNGDDADNGDEGTDSIIGGRGTDMICGGQDGSDDHLDGGVGADVIFGHAVYDIFFAGKHDEDPLDDVLVSSVNS
jgi:ELWxxDGT repeat protein